MKLTKREADLLGMSEWDGDEEGLRQTYWVLDDAPYPYYEREKMMGVVARFAEKVGVDLFA